MTDYTEMTDAELSDVLMEADAAQGEISRRSRLAEASRQIAQILFQVERDLGDQVDVLVAALGTTQQDLDPFGSGDGWDTPVIDDTEAAEVIAALQARIDAV
jgi:hypothetical protein